jgi:hypothetical protein
LEELRWLLLKRLLVFFYVISIANSDVPKNLLEVPSVSPISPPLAAPAIPDLPLPANLPTPHKLRHKHFSPRGAPTISLSPAHTPIYDPLVTSTHPPTSPRLSKPLMKRSRLAPPIASFENIAPADSNTGERPSGLAQPPLSPYGSSKLYCQSTCIYIYIISSFLIYLSSVEQLFHGKSGMIL